MAVRLVPLGLIAALSLAQTAPQLKNNYELDLPGNRPWSDTGIDLLPGARLQISASGTLQYPNAQSEATPDGLPRGWKDLMRILPVNDAGRGALIGRIGDDEAAGSFLVGAQKELRSPRAGRLFLGLNQSANEVADGAYHVSIQILNPGSSPATVLVIDPEKARPLDLHGINNGLFARIPRRVTDVNGDPGDMVNFLILATEQQMRAAFSQAGWVEVDRNKKAAVLHGLIATLSKEAYVQLPMSELYLFNRPQDFGLAHAEPFRVVEQRHHLRLWRAPFDVDGQPLWVGAATHDIGIERDERNNGYTHKIDPSVDLERRYVAESLSDTGLVARLGYFLPSSPVTGAHTATGGTFHSDGRVLVMKLADSPDDPSPR